MLLCVQISHSGAALETATDPCDAQIRAAVGLSSLSAPCCEDSVKLARVDELARRRGEAGLGCANASAAIASAVADCAVENSTLKTERAGCVLSVASHARAANFSAHCAALSAAAGVATAVSEAEAYASHRGQALAVKGLPACLPERCSLEDQQLILSVGVTPAVAAAAAQQLVVASYFEANPRVMRSLLAAAESTTVWTSERGTANSVSALGASHVRDGVLVSGTHSDYEEQLLLSKGEL